MQAPALPAILRLRAACLVAAGLWLGACGGGSSAPPTTSASGVSGEPSAVAAAQKADTPVDPTIVAADNGFGVRLLQALLPDEGANVAISPLSVALVLQVIYNGAAGSSRVAMAQTLGLQALGTSRVNEDNAALIAALIDPDPKVDLTVANSLWIDQGSSGVAPSFTQINETYYGATIGDLEGAPADVNAWVDGETQGLIPNLLPPGWYVDAIVADVLYFKGQWSSAFDPAQTVSAPFTLSTGAQVSAPFMSQAGMFDYFAGALDGTAFQLVRLPYGNGRLSMLILLPAAGADPYAFAAGLSAEALAGWTAQLASQPLTIALPRFTAQYSHNLVPALATLGMGVTSGMNADFSDLEPGFVLNLVQHATVVEVDEAGTVAAAATGGGGIATVAVIPLVVRADHPFIYLIQDGETGAILFLGLLATPVASAG
jgi:serine protease inhibitor